MEALEPRQLLSGSVLQWSGGLTGNSLYSTETTLTPSNVNSSQFGLLKQIALPGGTGDQVYGQPLYVEGLSITGQAASINGMHNVVIVATELNNVYAYDTSSTSGYTLLWKMNLGTPIAHGASGGPNFNNFNATLGVTGTPVIDPATDMMYLDSTQEPSTGVFIHKIFEINITSGATVNSMTLGNVTGGVVPEIPGTSSDAVGGFDTFIPQKELQRPGLMILNGNVYVAYGSYGDIDPYHGWVLGFSENSLAMTAVFDDTPNQIPGGPTGGAEAHDGEGAIWMSGAEITTDGTSLYVVTANGDFDPDPAYGAVGDAVVKLGITNTNSSDPGVNGWGLDVADYFAPSNEATLGYYTVDLDLGTSGLLLLPQQGGADPNEAIMIGKQGVSYLLNLDNLGQYSSTGDNIPQEISLNGHGMWGTPTYFDGEVYYHAAGDVLMAYSLTNGVLSSQPVASGSAVINSEGATPVISSNGTSDGIVWETSNGGNLYAYDASTLREIYTTSLGGTDAHFAVPMVADGQVYAALYGYIDIFGEKPNPFASAPAVPTGPAVSNALGEQLTVSWTGTADTNETAFLIERSTNGVDFTQVGTAPVDATSYTDSNVTPGATYYYRVRAANPTGDSAYTAIVNASAQMYTTPNDYYTFDAGTGTTAADSGSANITGTLTGSASTPQWATGYNGDALSFSGDGVFNSTVSQSAVQVTASGISATLQGNATVAGWIKTTQTGNNNPNKAPALLGVTKLNGASTYLLANSQDGGADIRWGYLDKTGHIGVAVDGYKATANAADTFGVVSTTAVNDGQWHFVAFTRNSITGILQVFVDGVLEGTFVADTGNKSTAYNLIGAQVQENSTGAVTGNTYFNGEIDGLRMYNQVLNAGEMALLAKLPGSPNGLTAAPLSGTSAEIHWANTPLPGMPGITPDVQIEYRVGTTGTFSPLVTISGTLSSYTITGLTAGTQYQYEIQEVDTAGSSDFTTPAGVVPIFGSVAGRDVFYNDSVFDGDNPAANLADGSAIDTSKAALLPGGTATFANYTSYADGLNGIIVDISNTFMAANITAADFAFMTGNDSNPADWTAAPAPDAVAILPGAGAGGSTRVEFVWNSGDAVKNAWLQVTVLADADTNLPSADVFYFGNAVGDSGDSTADALVNATDQIEVRANAAAGVGVTDPFDYNRDGNVDSSDEMIARTNQTYFLNALQLITAPGLLLLAPAGDSGEVVGAGSPAASIAPVSGPVDETLIVPVILVQSASTPAPAIHRKPAKNGPAHIVAINKTPLPQRVDATAPLVEKVGRIKPAGRGLVGQLISLLGLPF